jgi:hypothetical protein
MSFDKKVRVYSKDDLTEKFGKGYKVEHANPRFFAAPKHSVDFVMTTNKTIADAYQARGIPRIYFNEDGEVVTEDGLDEQITKQRPEQRPEHTAEVVDTEEPVSTDTKGSVSTDTQEPVSTDTEEPVQPPYEETESASEEETQESASGEGEIDLEKMSAAQVKEYASRNLGGEFKTKKEAVEALEKVKGVGSKLTV